MSNNGDKATMVVTGTALAAAGIGAALAGNRRAPQNTEQNTPPSVLTVAFDPTSQQLFQQLIQQLTQFNAVTPTSGTTTPNTPPARVAEIVLSQGYITSNADYASFVDNTKYWIIGQWGGYWVKITNKLGVEYWSIITGNNTQQLIYNAISVLPEEGDYYEILGSAGLLFAPQQIIYNEIPPITTDYTTIVDNRIANRTLLYCVSTLDQPVTVRAFGNNANANTNISYISSSHTLTAGNVTTQITDFVIDGDLWHPFLGVQITPSVTPATVGLLTITADIQQ